MEMKSSLEMYQLVEPFISNDYQLECGDYFVVCNSINETTSSFVLKDWKLSILLIIWIGLIELNTYLKVWFNF